MEHIFLIALIVMLVVAPFFIAALIVMGLLKILGTAAEDTSKAAFSLWEGIDGSSAPGHPKNKRSEK